jgi:hypothetical protein
MSLVLTLRCWVRSRAALQLEVLAGPESSTAGAAAIAAAPPTCWKD